MTPLLAALVLAASPPLVRFERYELPNGLTVILTQDKRLPTVGVNVWYHVGAANETPGRSGFAHLFEHLMFQGSKHRPGNEQDLFGLYEAAGASDVNASTA
jgi:zinc protease